jgi:hypothetical protein
MTHIIRDKPSESLAGLYTLLAGRVLYFLSPKAQPVTPTTDDHKHAQDCSCLFAGGPLPLWHVRPRRMKRRAFWRDCLFQPIRTRRVYGGAGVAAARERTRTGLVEIRKPLAFAGRAWSSRFVKSSGSSAPCYYTCSAVRIFSTRGWCIRMPRRMSFVASNRWDRSQTSQGCRRKTSVPHSRVCADR